jgi:hypothetical protein
VVGLIGGPDLWDYASLAAQTGSVKVKGRDLDRPSGFNIRNINTCLNANTYFSVKTRLYGASAKGETGCCFIQAAKSSAEMSQ